MAGRYQWFSRQEAFSYKSVGGTVPMICFQDRGHEGGFCACKDNIFAMQQIMKLMSENKIKNVEEIYVKHTFFDDSHALKTHAESK